MNFVETSPINSTNVSWPDTPTNLIMSHSPPPSMESIRSSHLEPHRRFPSGVTYNSYLIQNLQNRKINSTEEPKRRMQFPMNANEIDSLSLMSHSREKQLMELLQIEYMNNNCLALSNYARERFFLHSLPSQQAPPAAPSSHQINHHAREEIVSKSALSPASHRRRLLPGTDSPQRSMLLSNNQNNYTKSPLKNPTRGMTSSSSSSNGLLHAQLQNEVRMYQRDQPVRFQHDLLMKEISENGVLLSKYRIQPQTREGITYRWRTKPKTVIDHKSVSYSKQTSIKTGQSTPSFACNNFIQSDRSQLSSSPSRNGILIPSLPTTARENEVDRIKENYSVLSVSSISSEDQNVISRKIKTAQDLCNQVTAHFTTLKLHNEQKAREIKRKETLVESVNNTLPLSLNTPIETPDKQVKSASSKLSRGGRMTPTSSSNRKKSAKSNASKGSKGSNKTKKVIPSSKSMKGKKKPHDENDHTIVLTTPVETTSTPTPIEKLVEIVPLPWNQTTTTTILKQQQQQLSTTTEEGLPLGLCPSSIEKSRTEEMRRWLNISPLHHHGNNPSVLI